jgi:hypothetical protein
MSINKQNNIGEIMLQVTKETFYKVEYHHLEKFAIEHLGLENYSFVQTQECGNDSSHEFDVGKRYHGYEEDTKKILYTKLVPMYRNRAILNMLCEKGLIPQGKYLINVCW